MSTIKIPDTCCNVALNYHALSHGRKKTNAIIIKAPDGTK